MGLLSNLTKEIIQLSPLLECDPTVCLPEKSKVTRGLARGWHNFSKRDKSLGDTPIRVIIGMLFRVYLHQTPCNRIPAALRQTPSDWIHVALWQTPSDWIHAVLWICRWTPCVFSVESREITIIGNTWDLGGNFLGISSRSVDLTMRPYD